MWISMPTLKSILGDDAAATLCANLGGVPIYVPQDAHPTHELAKTIGLRGMTALCQHYHGEYITVPTGGVLKEQILTMLDQGMKKRDIALACGVTERYVYLLAGMAPDRDERQLTFFSLVDKE